MHFEIFSVLGDQAWWVNSDPDSDDEVVAQPARTLRLGPDPGGMAICTFPDYKSLEAIVRDTEGQQELGIVDSGAYRNWGQEIL